MKIQSLFLISVATLLSHFAQTQEVVKKVLILNEGRYDYINQVQAIPVSLGEYDPLTKSYREVKTFDGVRFGSDLKIEGDHIYVAADNALIRLSLEDYSEDARITVEGIRKIALNDDKIYVTRGEYLKPFDSYLWIIEESDLSFSSKLDTITGPKYATEGVLVKDDKVYVAVNNGFDFGNEVGFLGIYDAAANYHEVDLGADGINPDNLMIDENDIIHTLNNKDYTGSSVSSYNIAQANVVTNNLGNVSAGCNTSLLYEQTVVYQEFGENKLYKFDPVNRTVSDSLELGYNFYGVATDPVSGNFYGTTTDFASSGALLVFENNQVIDSIAVGVSAGNIAFDVRDVTSIAEGLSKRWSVYPNPSKGVLHVNGDIGNYTIHSLDGKAVATGLGSGSIQLDLTPGVYFLSSEGVSEKLIVE